MRHSPAGGRVEVRAHPDRGRVAIEVLDEGPGIPEEEASRVFERFYRADPSRSRQHGGTGLGLGIVEAIVSAHGGGVSAAPGPEGGAVFTVRLPLAGQAALPVPP